VASRAIRLRSLAQNNNVSLAGGTRSRPSPSLHAGVAITVPRSGALLTGLATAVGPASRRGSRVGAMLTLLRLPLSAHLRFAPALFGVSLRDRSVGCAEGPPRGSLPIRARPSLSKRQPCECAVRFPVTAVESESADRVRRDGLERSGERPPAPVAENRDVQTHRPSSCRQ